MKIPGKRIKRMRLIHTTMYVVAIEVEMVIPEDDPDEPCYESEAIEFIREVEEHAKNQDVEWLMKHGKVYQALAA